MKTLYSKQGQKLRVWNVWTEAATVVVSHGQQGGKISEKRYDASPKNEGRANATTAEQQALVEAEAKYTKQLKSGYSLTPEEAEAFKPFCPMKAQNYNEHASKVKYPCIIQPKLDGQRLMVDKNGNAWSKQGEPLELPKHWHNVKELAIRYGGLDGEIYAGLKHKGGLALQEIVSAFRKENKNTNKLKYWIYDIPDDSLTQKQRYDKLMDIELEIERSMFEDVVVLAGFSVFTEEDGEEEYSAIVEDKFEGAVYRNLDGVYEFDKRSYNLIKRKPRQNAEAVVVSVRQDKNDDGVLLCEALNGKQVGVQFECLMRKDSDPTVNYRKFENALRLVGDSITYEYEDVGEDTEKGRGKPQKPVGVALREVLPNGEAKY
jgi:DNA ligase-1